MLATSLERPQLLYALIDVAAEATPHAARRGSLLGVRSSSVQASRALLEGHAASLLPKLYRGSCATPPPPPLAPLSCAVECMCGAA